MLNKNSLKNSTFFLYIIIYSIFIIRYFFCNIPLGYGIGDVLYIGVFSFWGLFCLIYLLRYLRKNKFIIVLSILNILMTIYLLSMMLIFVGTEAK